MWLVAFKLAPRSIQQRHWNVQSILAMFADHQGFYWKSTENIYIAETITSRNMEYVV